MSKFVPSKYQVAIFDTYENEDCNISVQACPGSGKTRTVTELLKRTPVWLKVLMVAFNKSISEELTEKVNSMDLNLQPDISTIHSLAFKILRSQNRGARYKINGNKNFILGKKYLDLSHIKDFKKQAVYLFTVSRLIDLFRLNLAKTKEDLNRLADEYNVTVTGNEIDDTLLLMDKLNEYNFIKNHRGQDFLIDFTDMLWLTHKSIYPDFYPKYNVLFIDECQDLSPLQREVLLKCLHKKGRFVAVGDKFQAIYSFQGSNLDSFNHLISLPNTKLLPLSVSYRCPKKVVEFAGDIFEGIEPYEGNILGEIKWGLVSEAEDGDFILCRNNLPLVITFIELIKLGKQANIMGKDYGQSLLSYLNKLQGCSDFKVGCEEILKIKEGQLKDRGISNPKKSSSYQNVVEKLNILGILVKEFGSIGVAYEEISEMFNDSKKGGVTLSTIHKSKGLETDRVFIVGYDDLLPSKYATTKLELYQEQALKYVAVTRAKKELIFCKLPKYKDLFNK